VGARLGQSTRRASTWPASTSGSSPGAGQAPGAALAYWPVADLDSELAEVASAGATVTDKARQAGGAGEWQR